MRSNSCRNWLILTGMTRSVILIELEIYVILTKLDQRVNEMMTTTGKKFKNF